MEHIVIVSSSIRIGRESNKVAMYFEKYIQQHQLATCEIVELKEFNFPLFEERLAYLPHPSEKEKLFSEKIAKAAAVIVVFPEYNGGYPASIKNAIDLLYNEWYHKPIGLVCVSSGDYAGVNALAQLQTIFLKVRAVPVFPPFSVPQVQNNFDVNGNAVLNKETFDKKAGALLKELVWFATAFNKMK